MGQSSRRPPSSRAVRSASTLQGSRSWLLFAVRGRRHRPFALPERSRGILALPNGELSAGSSGSTAPRKSSRCAGPGRDLLRRPAQRSMSGMGRVTRSQSADLPTRPFNVDAFALRKMVIPSREQPQRTSTANGNLGGSTPSDGGSTWVDSTGITVSSNEVSLGRLSHGRPRAWSPARRLAGFIRCRVVWQQRLWISVRWTAAISGWCRFKAEASALLSPSVWPARSRALTGPPTAAPSAEATRLEVEVTSGNVWTVSRTARFASIPAPRDSAHSTATKICVGGYSGGAKYDDLSFTDTASSGVHHRRSRRLLR